MSVAKDRKSNNKNKKEIKEITLAAIWRQPGLGVEAQEQRLGNNGGVCTNRGNRWQLRLVYRSGDGWKKSSSRCSFKTELTVFAERPNVA